MFSRVMAFIIALLLIGLIIAIMILIPEINIIVFSSFLYVCIKSIRDVEFKEKFFIKSKRILYICMVLSVIVIISLIVYLAIVDPSTLTYTLIVSFALFIGNIKSVIKSLVHKKDK